MALMAVAAASSGLALMMPFSVANTAPNRLVACVTVVILVP